MSRCTPLLVILSLSALTPAWSQDANETARATAARVLAKAKQAGALERVLGTRYLYCEEEGQEGLLEVTCSYYGDPAAPEPEGLELVAKVTRIAEGRTVTITQRVRLDGQLVSSRCEGLAPARMGPSEPDPTAVVEVTRQGDRLIRRVTRDGVDPAETELEWSDDALPGLFVGWVLSTLHDQGLPVNLTFFLFNGVKLEDTDTRLSKLGRDERGYQLMRVITQMGPTGLVRYDVALFTEGDQEGQMAGGRFDVWSRQAPLFKLISAERAAELKGEK